MGRWHEGVANHPASPGRRRSWPGGPFACLARRPAARCSRGSAKGHLLVRARRLKMGSPRCTMRESQGHPLSPARPCRHAVTDPPGFSRRRPAGSPNRNPGSRRRAWSPSADGSRQPLRRARQAAGAENLASRSGRRTNGGGPAAWLTPSSRGPCTGRRKLPRRCHPCQARRWRLKRPRARPGRGGWRTFRDPARQSSFARRACRRLRRSSLAERRRHPRAG